MTKVALVTGAGGFVGRRLTATLLRSGFQRVVCLDVRFADGGDDDPRVVTKVCNICDGAEVVRLLRWAAPDVVLHVASYGMSGPAQLRTDVVHAVNVGGTRNVLQGCVEAGVPACVYISTYNVVFNGCTIENGSEAALPLLPPEAHVDPYSRTKAEAERIVLEANGNVLKGDRGGVLLTCAVRPAAIYGEGEERHLPRIVRVMNSGLGCFGIGQRSTLCDWVYIDNLTHGIALAANKLLELHARSNSASSAVGVAATAPAGRAYALSDDFPVNNFDWVARMLGQEPSSLFPVFIPAWFMYGFAIFCEFLYRVAFFLGAPTSYEVDMALTRAEICKVAYTHYFSMSASKRDLGYTPPVSAELGVARTAACYGPLIAPLSSRMFAALTRVLGFVLVLALLTALSSLAWRLVV